MAAPVQFDPLTVPESLREPLEVLVRRDNLKLPILSASISKLLATCNQDCPEMDQIIGLVSADQSLAAHVLRLANSVAYAPINELVTIDDAVRRLGIRAIGDMAIGHMVLNGVAKRDSAELRGLWRHAAVAGLYAYRIGAGIGLRGRASLMPGLLMDVGRPLAIGLLDDLEKQIGELIDPSTKLYLVEMLHTELGAQLVEQWQLPPSVLAAVRYHDCYEEAGEFALEAKIANLAGLLTAWALDPEEIHNESLMEVQVVSDLEISERLLSQLMSGTEEILITAKAFE